MQAVQEAANRAIDHLAAINKTELMETDAAAYSDAAIRVGASRWSAVPATPASTGKAAKLTVVTSPGQPGETCVALVDAKHDAGNPLASRCTYGIVWPASAAANADGSALALAVQTGDTWREMWVFKKQANGWSVDILPPGSTRRTWATSNSQAGCPAGRKCSRPRGQGGRTLPPKFPRCSVWPRWKPVRPPTDRRV